MDQIFVKPADPSARIAVAMGSDEIIPVGGLTVPNSFYIARRINDGSLVRATADAPAADPVPPPVQPDAPKPRRVPAAAATK